MRDMSKIVDKVIDGGKVVVAVVAALAVAEGGFVAAGVLDDDIKTSGKLIKHSVDPEPVYTKKSFFSKKKVSTVNPVTGNIKDYNGSKKPVNKKAIRLDK